MTRILSMHGETFNKLKENKTVTIQSKSSFSVGETLSVSNGDVTTNNIVARVKKKDNIRSVLHGQMFLYTLECI